MYTIKVVTGSRVESFPSVKAGTTLLEALLEHGVPVQHHCGGVCHCTTCHLYVKSGSEFIEEPSRRETAFLAKVASRTAESRLSCQCLLLDGSGEIRASLP